MSICEKSVLDPTCGSKMFYFDKNDPRVLFGDIRSDNTVLCDGRSLVVNPDLEIDFRELPFDDNYFDVVVFDPPHLERVGKKAWLRAKYGALGANWRDDLSRGFSECFRVLKHKGVLFFKWNETQITVSEILALTSKKPLIGHRSGKHMNTHSILFLKD